MALTVEDGSIVAGADSFVTLEEYTERAEAYGWTLAGTDTANEVNLRLGMRYLESAYRWRGSKVSAAQSLAWPRDLHGAYVDGFEVDEDTIPPALKNAQMEMAFLIQNGAAPFATSNGGRVKRQKKKVDVIETETEYTDAGAGQTQSFPLVDALVMPYSAGKSGGSVAVVPLVRG